MGQEKEVAIHLPRTNVRNHFKIQLMKTVTIDYTKDGFCHNGHRLENQDEVLKRLEKEFPFRSSVIELGDSFQVEGRIRTSCSIRGWEYRLVPKEEPAKVETQEEMWMEIYKALPLINDARGRQALMKEASKFTLIRNK